MDRQKTVLIVEDEKNIVDILRFNLQREGYQTLEAYDGEDGLEKARTGEGWEAEISLDPALGEVFDRIRGIAGSEGIEPADVEIGSLVYAVKPGDGSAREQAASCQRVIGGLANICREYATKRYRSNVINWGMIPFQMEAEPDFEVGDYIYVPGIKAALDGDMKAIAAYVVPAEAGAAAREISLYIADMTNEEREIVKAGCLINYNRKRAGKE